ncbi:Fn3-like domain-containing protein [Lacticaseibacillus camelliae]|uniref:Fn3-like domain-containing protein n=1 Tax=Lacticaseibacillus camelliae TaxID=381742 RepID=UPI0006D297E2|nr:Fn3-like domain-containing protein [Lacticaseibacillus camelliae]
MTVKGKGAASLKEIGDKATFTINLKNNGKTDISYNFNDFGGAYTKAVDEDKNVYDKHISGSTLKADAEEFDLKAGESKDVTVTLTLPNGFHKSQWAEGFVGFKSNTSDSPDLSMAFLGFYGNWDSAQKIFDGIGNSGKSIYPDESAYVSDHGNFLMSEDGAALGLVWDSEFSDTGSTPLGRYWYDANYVAISPNGMVLRTMLLLTFRLIVMLRNLRLLLLMRTARRYVIWVLHLMHPKTTFLVMGST